ncbi:17467_t:CDS:2 [Funneliformis caledonium]|uniref:17467_t:CDS:1 n=1 Tax=Funneliformis caledonium TaxID=1117310 RepID=A0A9N9E3L0_9GLOM|nr:17467_t:CDS:2 [Funneliformis caledonium]
MSVILDEPKRTTNEISQINHQNEGDTQLIRNVHYLLIISALLKTKEKLSKAKLAEALRRKLDIGQANPYFLLALPIVRNERILLSIFWSLSSGSEFTDQQMYHFN